MGDTVNPGGQSAPNFALSPKDFVGNSQVYEAYGAMRACPVHHTDALGGFYWLTRYDDIGAATRNGKVYSSAAKGIMLPPDEASPRIYALEQEAPDHMPAKRLYMAAMSPARLKALQPEIVGIANGLIDTFAGTGTCDLMKDFAHTLPVLVMCSAIGVKDVSVDRIREIASGFGKDPATRQKVIMDLGGLVLGELLERRAHPTGDYLSIVANAELGGRLMDEGELARFMVGFLTAGHETTTSTLGSFLFHVLRRPDLVERMRVDDDLLAAAVEETVRLTPPFHAFHRTTTEDTDVGGITIPGGSTVRLCYASANRDPAAFERPDEFDPTRPARPHFGFGGGRHMCAGAPMARLEIGIAFRTLLRRLPDIRLASDTIEYLYLDGTFVRPRSVEARFTPIPIT
jgi:cytochrome P450